MISFLGTFGLRNLLPRHTRDEDDALNLDDRSAIALPLLSSSPIPGFPAVGVEAIYNEIGFTDGNVYDVFPDVFVLPSDAEVRFLRLIHTYRLVAEQVTDRDLITADFQVEPTEEELEGGHGCEERGSQAGRQAPSLDAVDARSTVLVRF